MKLIAACAFGIEAIVKRELIALGYEPKVEQPGRIAFQGEIEDICRTNIWLRCADRVLIEIQKFDCPDFDALFDTIKAFDWSKFIPANAAFPVVGKSRLSKLTSVPAVQRTTKKALVECLQKFHGVTELPETAGLYKVEVALLNDVATLTIDTTGPSLHKRGYRQLVGAAPLKETLAAALVDLSVWKPERPLIDPFCGSGTIPIEAALIGRNVAPGVHRDFSATTWLSIPQIVWQNARDAARAEERKGVDFQIVATDRDPEALSIARYHARQAGVEGDVQFQQKTFDEMSSQREYGCVITNPPYGERLEEQERLIGLYESIPMVMQRLPTWSLFLITNMPRFEKLIQRRATRRRKLFNGRIECTFFQFLGPRPPRPVSANSVVEKRPVQAATDAESMSNASAMETPAAETLTDQTSVKESSQVDKAPAKEQRPTPAPPNVSAPGKVVSKDLTQPTDPHKADPHKIEPTQKPTSLKPISQGPTSQQATSAELDKQSAGVFSGDQASPEEITEIPKRPRVPKPEVGALFGQLTDKDYEQAGLFSSRLKKRARHLRKWANRGVPCYRLYERDIPEIPLVVDRYENYLHITEYERPHERDLARHAAWLDLMAKAASDSLEIPAENTFLKQRRKGEEGQYKKLDEKQHRVVVNEQGLKFVVNLEDYVDTGLFLDHRVTRKMVREKAEGKDFLNLFAYTGSFSVYAAAGGAASTTTVDLSKTYLDWAQDNFKANGLWGPSHQLVAADTIEYLNSIRNDGEQFDLAVVDPPTYSNSKSLEDDWDVQTGYSEVLQRLWSVMRVGGEVYFSTNFRRFKFDETLIGGFEAREVSKQTVPEDFRNRRIHRCWWLKKR